MSPRAPTLPNDADGDLQVILLATGSEVQLAVAARESLQAEGIGTRVVSVPCLDWFEVQDAAYIESVLPAKVTARVSVEAGIAAAVVAVARFRRSSGLVGALRCLRGRRHPVPRVRLHPGTSLRPRPRIDQGSRRRGRSDHQAKPRSPRSREPAMTTSQAKNDSSVAAAVAVGLDHISLRVPDYDASLAWYQDTSISLCYVSGPTPVSPGLRLCHLQLGNSKLELIGGGQPHPRSSVSTVEDHLKPAGVIHLCLTVTDLEATTATLRSKGVEPFAGPLYVDALDITLVVIKDNSGNVLEIAQSG